MPVFNRAAFLPEAVASVLGQSAGDLELIVVDDGSTDGTAAVLDAVRDPRVHILRQDHRGISAAMNTGLRAARGRYVARLDSDDVWFAELLERTTATLDAEPGVGVVYTRAQAMSAGGAPREHHVGLPLRDPTDALLSLLWGDATCNITAVARRACLEEAGGWNESLRTHEDWDLWLRVARRHRFEFLPVTLARFREHEGGITNPASPRFVEHIESRVRVLDTLYAAPDLPARVRAFRPTAYRNVHTEIGLFLLDNRHWRRALAAFRRAVVAGGPASLVRILWFTAGVRTLRRFSAGRRLLQLQAAVRHRLRARRPPGRGVGIR